MKPMEKEVEDENGEKKIERYFIMQSYNVFNITQTEGIKYEKEFKNEMSSSHIQEFIDSFNIPTFRGEPAYSPTNDSIFMPHFHEFDSDNFGTGRRNLIDIEQTMTEWSQIQL